ncbi:testican-3 isoform X7 [Cetorhinus maximus]
MMIKVLICVVAVAFLQIEGRQRATSDSGNFLDDKQWLTTISQYDKEPGHWNKFRDDDYFRSWNTGRHLDQGLDSTKDPCLNVKCSRHKVCIAQDNHRVVCISHRRLTHSMKETDLAHKQWKGSNCKPCPVVHPHPICGTDGHVYSSPCKLEYQACVSGKQISVKCEGRCPCSSDKSSVEGKDEKQAECSDREFREVVSRLKDWFKVLHENGNHNKKARGLQRQGKDRVNPPCQMELSNIQRQQRGKKLLGIFLPTCDEDGYYKATQCHGSVGQCWCVDRYGNEMRGSRSSGSPDCGGDIEISGDFGSGDFHEWSDDEDDEEDTNDEEEDDEVDNEDDEDDDDEYDVGGYIW